MKVSTRPRAWSLRLISYTFKASTQGNNQRDTIVSILISLNLLLNLLPFFITVLSLLISHYSMIELSKLFMKVITKQ